MPRLQPRTSPRNLTRDLRQDLCPLRVIFQLALPPAELRGSPAELRGSPAELRGSPAELPDPPAAVPLQPVQHRSAGHCHLHPPIVAIDLQFLQRFHSTYKAEDPIPRMRSAHSFDRRPHEADSRRVRRLESDTPDRKPRSAVLRFDNIPSTSDQARHLFCSTRSQRLRPVPCHTPRGNTSDSTAPTSHCRQSHPD